VERGRKYLAKFDGDARLTRSIWQTARCWSASTFARAPAQRRRTRKTLAAWLSRSARPAWSRTPAELQNEAFTKSYGDMTVEEFRARWTP
jgi:hypothetical protein